MACQTGTFTVWKPALIMARNSFVSLVNYGQLPLPSYNNHLFSLLSRARPWSCYYLKTSVGDYSLKYMAIIIPTNGRGAQSKGSFYRAQNCTSNPVTSQILWPGHFTLCSIVYGFNGRLLPGFMAAVAFFNSGNMPLTLKLSIFTARMTL